MRGQLKWPRHNLQTIADAAQRQKGCRRGKGRVVGLGNAQRLSCLLRLLSRPSYCDFSPGELPLRHDQRQLKNSTQIVLLKKRLPSWLPPRRRPISLKNAGHIVSEGLILNQRNVQGVPKKTDTQFYFGDNFGNSAPILTILSLLQAEIYGA